MVTPARGPGDGARLLGDPGQAGPGERWQAQTLCPRSLPGGCPSDRGNGRHDLGRARSHRDPALGMALERACGNPGALRSRSHGQRQGAPGHPDPVCPDSWGGRCRGLNGGSARRFSSPECPPRALLGRGLRMNPRRTCHVRGRTRVMTVTGLMAGIPLCLPVCRRHPTATHPVRRAAPRCRRQTQVGAGGGDRDMPEPGDSGVAQPRTGWARSTGECWGVGGEL